MSGQATAIIFLVATAILYGRSQVKTRSSIVYGSPSTQSEVDVTRWRHDGEQPLFYKSGNQAEFLDKEVQKLHVAFGLE